MIKVQPFKVTDGFGDGSKYGSGEYLHSEGMTKSQNGLLPFWKATSLIDSLSLTDLAGPLNFIKQAAPGGTNAVYGVDSAGTIFQYVSGAWSLAYKPGVQTYGNGLQNDQKGNLLYAGTRYLGRYDGTANYTTGTIAVTNGSAAVVGPGTTFTNAMVDRRIVINGVWYTISAFTDATHITLSANYAGTTASGLSYAIYVGWNDKYKDFGSDIAPLTAWRTMDIYEDWVVIMNQYQIALYNITDNSFTVSGFTLPNNYLLVTAKAGRTGLLMGANFGNRCALILWDTYSNRSIAPWLWINANVQSIITDPNGNWIVITNRNIIRTNGYTVEDLAPIPDGYLTGTSFSSVIPQGAEVVRNYLIIGQSGSAVNRIRSGFWILNLATRLYEYCPTANNISINNTMGAIFFDSSFVIHASWRTLIPNKSYIGTFGNDIPSRAHVITQPLAGTSNNKTVEAVKLNLGLQPSLNQTRPITFNVAVKVTNFKRTLWGYAQQKTTAVVYNQITVDGTVGPYNNAQVGDEVTVLEGTNAGQTAHIIAIANQDTSTEVWTLDTSFTGYTETNAFIQVTPFRLLSKQVLLNQTQLKDLYFNCKSKLKGRDYLLKIVFDNMQYTAPELISGDFIYDDLSEL